MRKRIEGKSKPNMNDFLTPENVNEEDYAIIPIISPRNFIKAGGFTQMIGKGNTKSMLIKVKDLMTKKKEK